MTNIILQHWTGDLNELCNASINNIKQYAKSVGAEYKLIRGNVFCDNLKKQWPPLQKLVMLDGMFDEYDKVAMLDIDMFIRKGMTKNIFTDIPYGIGYSGPVHKKIHSSFARSQPNISNKNHPYWGGAIYILTKEQRIQFRKQLRGVDLNRFCSRAMHGDEGCMHHLAVKAKYPLKNAYIPDAELWNWSSRDHSKIKESYIIHIRAEKDKTKIQSYKELVKKGII